ncbi:hypothetical protein ACIKT0_15185, partial [Hansschlegelia beijingensis]
PSSAPCAMARFRSSLGGRPQRGDRHLDALFGGEMPISAAVAEVLAGRVSVGAAVAGLLARPLKSEI